MNGRETLPDLATAGPFVGALGGKSFRARLGGERGAQHNGRREKSDLIADPLFRHMGLAIVAAHLPRL